MALSLSSPAACRAFDAGLSHFVIPRHLVGHGLNVERGLRDRGPDRVGGNRIGLFEYPAHRVGGLREQFQQIMARQPPARSEASGEFVIVLGPRDHCGEAEIGKLGALIAGGTEQNRALAPVDQHVGDRLIEIPPERDGQEMVLALGARELGEQRAVEPDAMLQDRRRDVDGVVGGQRAADRRWRARDHGQALRERRPRRGLDARDQARKHVVEQRDLIVRIDFPRQARTGRQASPGLYSGDPIRRRTTRRPVPTRARNARSSGSPGRLRHAWSHLGSCGGLEAVEIAHHHGRNDHRNA